MQNQQVWKRREQRISPAVGELEYAGQQSRDRRACGPKAENVGLNVDARPPVRQAHVGGEPMEGRSFGIRRREKQVSLTARQDGHLASAQSHKVALVVTDPRFPLKYEVKWGATEAVLREAPTLGELHAGEYRATQLQTLEHLIDRVQISLIQHIARGRTFKGATLTQALAASMFRPPSPDDRDKLPDDATYPVQQPE
jgi:hypothetical protein